MSDDEGLDSTKLSPNKLNQKIFISYVFLFVKNHRIDTITHRITIVKKYIFSIYLH